MAFITCQPIHTFADEVKLDDRSDTPVTLGDFECSSCPDEVVRSIGIFKNSGPGEISAGELWKFFHSQGVESLDRLTLCLDIQQINDDATFDLRRVDFSIEDNRSDGNITEVSSRGKTLIVPGAGSHPIRPEAKLEVMLDYDFMKRFSADSKELVKLNFASDSEQAENAKFMIGADSEVFSRSNFMLLFGFVGFWGVVFLVLNRVTRPTSPDPTPSIEISKPVKLESETSKRALSA